MSVDHEYCESCEVNKAEFRVSATTLDGELVDMAEECRTCAESRGFRVVVGK